MEGLKNFKCPICFDLPDKEIFQCINGHSVCHRCSANSSSCCPICQAHYRQGKVRNCALESLLDPIDFECIFKVVGCTQTYKRGELKEHIKTCDYSRRNILLCKTIGYERCQFIPSGHSRSEILEHFRAFHEDVFIQNGSCAHLRLEDIVSVARRIGDFWWSPTLMNCDNNETGPLFLILASTNAKENLTTLMCLLLWADTQPNDSNLFADFCFKSVTDGIPEFKWTLPAIDIQEAKSFLEGDIPWKVSTSFLTQRYLSDTGGGRDVVVEVTLTRRNKRKVNAEGGTLVENCVFGSRSQPSTLNTPRTNGASTSHSILDRVPIPIPSSSNAASRTQTPLFAGDYVFDDPILVTCDVCNTEPIQGIRYKCTQCINYDLCPNCVQDGGHHDHHIFVLIRNADQNKNAIRWHDRSKSKTPKLLNKEAEPMDADDTNSIHKDFTCEICSKKMTIGERLYRCLTCAECFICSECINQDQQHSQKHVFAMIRDCEQFKLVHDNRHIMAVKLRCNKLTGYKRKLSKSS